MNVNDEIKELLNKVDRIRGSKLIKDLDKLGYFTCPASTNKHNCFEGGLALHSYNVYTTLCKFNEVFKLDLDEDFIIITSLLHDVCKLGVYKPNILKNGKISDTKPYKYEDMCPLGHGEKSVIFLSYYLKLTTAEALAIRWHIGPFTHDTIQGWNFEKTGLQKTPYYKEIMAVYHADSFASCMIEDCGAKGVYHNT